MLRNWENRTSSIIHSISQSLKWFYFLLEKGGERNNGIIIFSLNSFYFFLFDCFIFPSFSSMNHHSWSPSDVIIIGVIVIDKDGLCHPSYSSTYLSQWYQHIKLRENKDQEVSEHQNQHHENSVKQTKNKIIVKKMKNQMIYFVDDFLFLFYIIFVVIWELRTDRMIIMTMMKTTSDMRW